MEFFLENYRPPDWELKFYSDYLDSDGIDFVGRFETREEDLSEIEQKCGVSICSLVHDRKTSRNHDYRKYYNSVTQEMVGAMFRNDIKTYNYKF